MCFYRYFMKHLRIYHNLQVYADFFVNFREIFIEYVCMRGPFRHHNPSGMILSICSTQVIRLQHWRGGLRYCTLRSPRFRTDKDIYALWRRFDTERVDSWPRWSAFWFLPPRIGYYSGVQHLFQDVVCQNITVRTEGYRFEVSSHFWIRKNWFG